MTGNTSGKIICKQCKFSKNHPNDNHLLDCHNPACPPNLDKTHQPDYLCDFGSSKITNAKQNKTLEKIFREHAPADITWKDISALFQHIGFEVDYSDGASVSIQKNGCQKLFFHKPHGADKVKRGAIRKIVKALKNIGAKP
jgi:hypothetical protein